MDGTVFREILWDARAEVGLVYVLLSCLECTCLVGNLGQQVDTICGQD